MADIEDGFRIEATVKVYLHWDHDEKKWVVSPCTVDGCPLDLTDAGLYTDQDGDYDSLTPAQQIIWGDAAKAVPPSASELWELLGDAIREADNA